MPNNLSDRELIARIGDRIRDARHKAKVSQVDAAKRLGVPTRTLRSWELGERSQPAYVVLRLADLYGVSAEWLLAHDNRFFALIDPVAEEEAVTAVDSTAYAESTQRVSVLITDNLSPMRSRHEWQARMRNIEAAGAKFRSSEHGD